MDILTWNNATGTGFNGIVTTYVDLPVIPTVAIGVIYLVRQGSGSWFQTRHQPGIYQRVDNTGTRDTDWQYLGEWLEEFNDANFSLYNNTTKSKELKFDLSSIGVGTTRTLTAPNASGTIALTSDLANYQPLDADLTAIAALSTTSFGRGLLTEASASTARGTLGLGNVENTALSTWGGSFNLKSFGNISAPFGVAGLNSSTQIPSPLFSTPIGSINESSRWVKSASNPVLVPSLAYEQNALQEPNVIFEDGVFKMWYSAGWMAQALAYATSTDGTTWVKYGSTPILGQGYGGVSSIVRCTTIVKIDGVYRLYFADNNPNANLKLATSVDGLTWVVQGVVLAYNVLAGIGGWANTAVFRDPSGVWYMLAEGFVSATSSWNTFLLTSSNGSSWSFLNSSNPLSSLQIVAGGMYGGPHIPVPYRVNGLYHLWYHASTSAPNLPTNIYHAYSSDLINWTVVTPSPALQHSGIGYEIDQVADACIVEALGKTWLFFDEVDNVTPKAGIGVAIISGTLADIINKAGSFVRQFDTPEFSGLLNENDKAMSWRDSSGAARRMGLWSTINNIYWGDIDNTNNSNVFLMAGGSGMFQFYTNGSVKLQVTNDGSVESSGHIRTGAPVGSDPHNWKLGEYTSGIIKIDIDGAGVGLPSIGSNVDFNRVGIGVSPTYALHIAPPIDPAFGVFDRPSSSSYAAVVLNTGGSSSWMVGMLPGADTYRVYDYALGDYVLSIVAGSGIVTVGGSIQTSAPSGGTSSPAKHGIYHAGAPTATGYIEEERSGVTYKVLVST